MQPMPDFKTASKLASERIGTLNERERSLVRMFIQGMPHKTIASRLGLSVRTIEQCKKVTLEKTGTISSAQLAAVAVLSGASEFWTAALHDCEDS